MKNTRMSKGDCLNYGQLGLFVSKCSNETVYYYTYKNKMESKATSKDKGKGKGKQKRRKYLMLQPKRRLLSSIERSSLCRRIKKRLTQRIMFEGMKLLLCRSYSICKI